MHFSSTTGGDFGPEYGPWRLLCSQNSLCWYGRHDSKLIINQQLLCWHRSVSPPILQIQVWLCAQTSKESTAIVGTPTSLATWRTVSDLSTLCAVILWRGSAGAEKKALLMFIFLCFAFHQCWRVWKKQKLCYTLNSDMVSMTSRRTTCSD